MAITIGFYDLFSYAIPGVFYLYILNEVSRLLKLPYVDINQLDNLTHAIFLLIVAYVIGHIFDYLSSEAYVRPFHLESGNRAEESMKIFNLRHPELNHQLHFSQWQLYLAAIRLKNPQVEDRIIYHNAVSIMLRNISFALVLFSGLQLVLFVINGFQFQYLLIVVFALSLSRISLFKSYHYGDWYYLSIYESVINYGSSLEQILDLRSPSSASPATQAAPGEETGNGFEG